MRIKTKILWTVVCMALLVAIIGGFAINRQEAVGVIGVTMGAEDVARMVGFAYAADKDPAHRLTQELVQRLYKELGHDVQIIDAQKRLIADALPDTALVEKRETSKDVDDTLRDGQPRTFIEKNPEFPQGTRQVAMPMKDGSGKVVGAVIMEYTPHYRELMEMTREMTRQVIVAVLAGGVIIVALGLYTGDSIVTPLRMLTKAAAAFATGQQDTPLPPRRKDEIGELTAAFNIMMQRRCQAVAALRAARDDMERRVNERTAELAEANSKLKEEVAERRAAEEMAVEAEGWVRQFAEEIDRERERFVAILNTVPAVVFEDWPSNGGSSFVSQYVETMYGYSQQEWISTPDFWTKLVHPDDMERVMKEAARMLAGEEDVDFRAVRWVRKDGRVIWGETRFTLIRDPKDGSLGVRGFTLDITERKRSEEELAKLHKQLLETSRHAGMAEVATNVLHNVGNVLNSVNISAGLAAEQIQNSSVSHLMQVAGLLEKNVENIGEYMAADPVGQKLPGFLIQLAPQLELERTTVLGELEQLVKNVEHIKDIVAVQQSYASVAGVSQTIPVVELVEDSLRMNAGALMRHDVQLVRDYQATPVIQVDKHKVMQILVNLIRNAKYACDESGREDKHLTVQIASEDRLVRISIVDDGVGIPAENLTRIFSHGFTTRKTGHGFGLHSGALAAKELGGALLAHSDGPGLGAEFVLELPFESPQS